ncbi:MAG: TIGR03915 family putative DNA repair protein [Pyrinomonadaceae bacterium]
MIHVEIEDNFESWRYTASVLLARAAQPGEIVWTKRGDATLFEINALENLSGRKFAVPKEFISLAAAVACFDDAEKWPLLYRILFRVVKENRNLLAVESDKDVRDARLMEKAVKRDVHKFHAFVRFRLIECDGEEIYVAWHEPQHWTVERATPFFARRFGSMTFSILTPKGCAHWDLKKLTFSAPADKSRAPTGDDMEEFWLLYYKSIFNPFRLKINAMKREFPVRHWPTLPEAKLIPELIRKGRELSGDS